MSHLKVVRRAVAAAFGLGAIAASALAQQPAAPPPITMKQLKPNVWAGIGGSGGNSTIIIGNTGVIVVDAKQTEAGAKDLLAEIAKITPKPVTTVFLTHSDGDHINGLVAYPAGIKIIAHAGNKKEQEAAIAAGGRGAPSADRLPNQVVTQDKELMTIDGVKLELYHWAPAHTSGDLVVYLPDQKVVATGDITVGNRADDNPNIHPEKNGSSEGWLTSVKGILSLDVEYLRPRTRRPADEGRHSAEARGDNGTTRQNRDDGEGRQGSRRDQSGAAGRAGSWCGSPRRGRAGRRRTGWWRSARWWWWRRWRGWRWSRWRRSASGYLR